MNIYNLKMFYEPIGSVTSANSKLCRVELVGASVEGGRIYEYSFEDNLELSPWEPHDFDEPLLRVTEKVNEFGMITHLIFRILSWSGMYLGNLRWGSNLYPIWLPGELEKPVAINIGKEKAISISLIQNPLIEEEPDIWPPPPPPPPPEPEPPNFFARIPWFELGVVCLPLTAILLLTGRKK